jgi:hypothetical protein
MNERREKKWSGRKTTDDGEENGREEFNVFGGLMVFIFFYFYFFSFDVP